jgi:hypothetical protein
MATDWTTLLLLAGSLGVGASVVPKRRRLRLRVRARRRKWSIAVLFELTSGQGDEIGTRAEESSGRI